MTHFVKIQPGITDPTQLYKRTEKKDGIKTTYVFQRDTADQPKDIKGKLMQKIGDLFSGIKKAKHSVTLLKLGEDLKRTGTIDKNFDLFSKDTVTKSVRLNPNFLTNIANKLGSNSQQPSLTDIQGQKFTVSAGKFKS